MKMHKLAGIMLAVCLITGPAFTSADTTGSNGSNSTTTSSTNVNIERLLEQIRNLQTQVATLQNAQREVTIANTNVSGSIQLIRNLKQGMSGEDIVRLQTLLASDPSIFPNGTIDGFFGSTTKDALKKFQKKHGYEQVGYAGPKTLNQLNKLIRELGLKKNNDTEYCIKVPPGHLVAPGLFKTDDNGKKNGKSKFKVVECDKVPPVSDTSIPVISQVGTANLLGTTTRVVWTTNELSNSRIWYGTSTSVSTNGAANISEASYVTSHSLSLSGLATSTTYYFIVASTDTSGNTATSSQVSFVTTAGL